MDPNAIGNLLLATLSPNAAEIKRAEEQLKIAKQAPGFPQAVLSLCRPVPGSNVHVAKAAAICFKNFVKLNWNAQQSLENEQVPDRQITDQEKAEIKAGVVDLMCSVEPSVQRQLSEGVRVIALQDWPYQWEDLLPRLTTRLLDTSQPIQVTNGVLSTMNELFKRFRDAPQSNELHMVLKIALDGCQEQLLQFFANYLCPATLACHDPMQADHFYAAVRFCCRIFYSLNWQTIPEYFEDHQKEWMGEFLKFLTIDPATSPFRTYDDEENPSPLERVQTAIFENVELYVQKYSNEFQPFLAGFLQAAFMLLVQASSSQFVRFDELANSGMRFVATAVASRENVQLFANEETLKAILERIVIPNLALRQYDIEAFEDNPIEYLRRDIEGSDAETRRRIACDLIDKLCTNFDDIVTKLCVGYIEQLLQKAAAGGSQAWSAKDAALTLVIAVSVRGSTQREGATKVKDRNIVLSFLQSNVYPELAPGANTSPILKADAIKYIAVFRQWIPKQEVLSQVFPLLINALDTKSVVVHTYAAAAIDGLLAVKEPEVPGGSPVREMRYKKHEVASFVQPILIKLFGLVDAGGANYNEYLMKCVVRVINVSRDDVGPVVPQILEKLSGTLGRVAANPANPSFNHFMFEAIAALLKFGFESQKCSVEQLEAAVNPAFGFILERYITEFVPYVLQIMAQTLLMHRTPGVPPHFQGIFGAILSPTIWETRANVPALVMLLEAYLLKGGDQLFATDDKIDQLFRIFQQLLALKSTEDLSFELMQCVVSFLPFEKIQVKVTDVMRLSLMKYSQTRSPMLAQSFVTFCGVLLGKRGPIALMQCVEPVQAGMFQRVVAQIMVPTMPKLTKAFSRKAVAIGVSRLLSEFQQNLDEPTWALICVAQVQLLSDRDGGLSDSAEAQLEQINEALERMAEAGHSTSFARLAFVRDEKASDLFPEVQDPRTYFVDRLLNQAGLGQRALVSLTEQSLATMFRMWAKGRV